MNTDQELIEKCLQGSESAFRMLVIKYQDYMYSVCYSVLKNSTEAEEATQDTFLKMHRSLASYNHGSKLSSWLYKIAYRTSLDYIRKRKPTDDISALKGNEGRFSLSEKAHSQKLGLSDHLLEVLEHLPPDDAALIRLFYLEEMNIKELEEITGLGKSNIKVKLFRARKKLFDIIREHFVELEDYLYN